MTNGSVGSICDVSPVSNASWDYSIIEVSPGDVYYIDCEGGPTARQFAFLDIDFKILAHSPSDYKGKNFLFVPPSSKYLVVNGKKTYGIFEVKKVEALSKNVKTIKEKRYIANNTLGSYVDVNSTTTSSDFFERAVTPVGGFSYIVCLGVGASDARLYSFLDANGVNIGCADSNTLPGNEFIPIPNGAVAVVFQSRHFGKLVLCNETSIDDDVVSEYSDFESKLSERCLSVKKSNGYCGDLRFPINLMNRLECTNINIDAEIVTGKISFTYRMGARSVITDLEGEGLGRKIYSLSIPPSILKEPIRLQVTPSGNVNLFSLSINYSRGVARQCSGIRYDAHLGMQTYAPENSRIAYSLAAIVGYNGCVCNPIFSADGTPYCYHENNVTLTTDGGTTRLSLSAAQFSALTDEEIADYRVCGTSSQASNFSEAIPTLNDFLKLCAFSGMKPVFSWHPYPTNEQMLLVKKMLLKYGLLDKVTIKTTSVSVLSSIYEVMGKTDGYVFDISSTFSAEAAQEKCDEMKATAFYAAGCRTIIEIDWSVLTDENSEVVINNGLLLGTSNHSSSSTVLKTALQRGVSLFTDKGTQPIIGGIFS